MQNSETEKQNHIFTDREIMVVGLANNFKNTEKRKHARHKCDAFITWSYFNKEIFYWAKLLNFSESGVYFETEHDLKPGVSLFMNMRLVPAGKNKAIVPKCPRSVSLGEVKWRVDLSGSDQSYYGVGVKYPFLS